MGTVVSIIFTVKDASFIFIFILSFFINVPFLEQFYLTQHCVYQVVIPP